MPERGAPGPCSTCRRCCVVIPIRSLEQLKFPCRSVVLVEHEPAACADGGEPADMHAGALALGADQPGQIAGLEAGNALSGARRALREAEAVVAVDPPSAAAGGGDLKRHEPRRDRYRGAGFSHARGVDPMVLGVALGRAVELGAPAGPERHRQPEGLERVPHGVAGRVHRRGIGQRALELGLDSREHRGPVGEEDLNGCVVLGMIAGHAGRHEVADAVGAAARAGYDVLDLQHNVLVAAVRAAVAAAVQDVLAPLEAGEFAALVADTGNLLVLESLSIEADGLHLDPGDRGAVNQPPGPGGDVADPAHQRRRQPARGPGAVVEARRAVAGRPGPTTAAKAAPIGEGGPDPVSAMVQVRCPQHDAALLRELTDEGDAGCLAAGVHLQGDGLHGAGFTVGKDNGEGRAAEHRGPTPTQQPPGACRRAGHQGLSLVVQNEHSVHLLYLNGPYGPARLAAVTVSSPGYPAVFAGSTAVCRTVLFNCRSQCVGLEMHPTVPMSFAGNVCSYERAG